MDDMGKKIERVLAMLKKEDVNAVIIGFDNSITTSWYANHASRLVLLNAAETEILVKDIENNERAETQYNSRVPLNTNKGDPTYLG